MLTKMKKNILLIAMVGCSIVILLFYLKIVNATCLEVLLSPFIVLVLLLCSEEILITIGVLLIKWIHKFINFTKLFSK
jgi:hypothetical protein